MSREKLFLLLMAGPSHPGLGSPVPRVPNPARPQPRHPLPGPTPALQPRGAHFLFRAGRGKSARAPGTLLPEEVGGEEQKEDEEQQRQQQPGQQGLGRAPVRVRRACRQSRSPFQWGTQGKDSDNGQSGVWARKEPQH